MQYFKRLFILILFFSIPAKVNADDIQVSTFSELINSDPVNGDTLDITDNLSSDESIGYNFYGLDITFEGNNHSLNGNNVFAGFVLNQESNFNRMRMVDCKGQTYNRSSFAGAIYNSGGNLNISESAFSGNFVDAAGFNFGVGGAVYNLSGGTVNIDNALFDDNYANGASAYGGAIANGYQATTPTYMSINNSIIQNNYSDGSVIAQAGALFNNGTVDINNTTLTNNRVLGGENYFLQGGAMYNLGTLSIINSTISDNYADGTNTIGMGGAIYNQNNLFIDNSAISGNYVNTTYVPTGGAIYNDENSTASITNTNITDNYLTSVAEEGRGGGIFNRSAITLENCNLSGNHINTTEIAEGAALYNDLNSSSGSSQSSAEIINSTFENNYISSSAQQGKGGGIFNRSDMTIENSVFKNNTVNASESSEGGAIYNDGTTPLTIINSTFENNSSKSSTDEGRGGAIYNNSLLAIENGTFKNNTDDTGLNDIYNTSDGTINLNAEDRINILSGISGSGTMNKNNSGALNLGGENKNYTGDFNFTGGTINLLADSSYFNAQNSNFSNNVNFNMQNNYIDSINFGNLNLDGTTNIFADMNLNTKIMDTVAANSITGSGELFISNLAIQGAPTGADFSIPFANSVLKDYVRYNSTTIDTPIYNYQVSYNSSDGNFDFNRSGFNSSIYAPAVAAQLAGYLTQLETYKNVFSNLDMVMITPQEFYQGLQYKNKTAAVNQFAFSPIIMPEERKGVWFKPYAFFEKVPLDNEPKVSNVSYGSLFGVESSLEKLNHGWYTLYGAYASYNGSHQAFDGNSIYNNGGLIGLDAVFYKGNFFTAWTANAGASAAEASTYFGNDNFGMFNTGIAQKTGYNFKTLENKLIIQPSLLASYSFINTFNYTTDANVHINADPLHAIHIEPQIKLIGNFKKFLQPYICVSFVWNIIDDTKFQANDVFLPELSVKPYVQYGVGIQKRWGERLTGFFETMIRNGGRNGVGLQFGLRFSI